MIAARAASVRRTLASTSGGHIGMALRKLAALRRRVDEAARRGAIAPACGATLAQPVDAAIASLDVGVSPNAAHRDGTR
jgi:hypothetical protein